MEGPFLILPLLADDQLLKPGGRGQHVNLQRAGAAALAGRDQRRGRGMQATARWSAAGKKAASLLPVHKHVDDLCATAPILCAAGGNPGDFAARLHP
jgi:hypothetical protein